VRTLVLTGCDPCRACMCLACVHLQEAVRQTGAALEHSWRSLRVDKELVIAAVRHYGIALQWASDGLKADIQVVEAAMRADCHALEHAAPQAADNPQLMLVAMEVCGEAELAPSSLW